MNRQLGYKQMVNEPQITSEEAQRWLNTIEFNHYTALSCLENRSEKEERDLLVLKHKVNNRKSHGPLCSHSCCW